MSARTFLHRFGYHDIDEVRLLARTPNRVYRVRADGRVYLLRFRGDAAALTVASARLQQRWLVALARDYIVAPVVVPLNGKPFAYDDDDHDARDDGAKPQAALFTWVHGRRLRDANAFVAPARLAAVGDAIARLHRHAERFRPRAFDDFRRFDVAFFFPPDVRLPRAADRALLEQLARRTRRALRDLAASPKTFGIIHGDLGPANWVFHRGAARPIDFDEFGVGPFAFDLAQVLWTHSMWPQYERYRANLLAAYERVRPLAAIERRHLRLFEALALVDWLNRALRARDAERATLKRWLAPTLKRVRDLAARPP